MICARRFHLFVFVSLIACRLLNAYPAAIGFGYNTCTTCHYNPAGGGALTDYGRALAATEFAAQLFSNENEEKLAKQSGFLGNLATLPPWLKLQADFRFMYLTKGLESSAATSRFIPMQVDGSAVLALDKDFWVSARVGLFPDPPLASSGSHTGTSLISREHYVGWRPAKGVAILAGMMDPIFGIRVPDHDAYMRKETGLNMSDQVHGAALHVGDRSWEFMAQGFMGNLFDPATARKGGALWYETDIAQSFRVGGSALYSLGADSNLLLGGVHTRFALGKGSSVLFQYGVSHRSILTPEEKQLGHFIFFQSRHWLLRGVYLLFTFEHYVANFSGAGGRLYRAGPSIELLPFQRLELRMDLLATKTFGLPDLTADSYALALQAHVWL